MFFNGTNAHPPFNMPETGLLNITIPFHSDYPDPLKNIEKF